MGDPVGLPFIWSATAGIAPLPTIGTGLIYDLDMTSDGAIVVGSEQVNGGWIPTVWDSQHRAYELTQVLISEHGFSPADIRFNQVRGISGDGRALLVVSPTEELFALYLDKPLVAPVPEPTSWLMFVFGLVTIAGRHRRSL